MRQAYHVFVCAGELSGDRLAARLVSDLRVRAAACGASLQLSGMGGPALRQLAPVRDMETIQCAGLTELLPRAHRVAGRFFSMISTCSITKPDLAILVDFPDFNLLLAAWLKARGIPVLLYVPPQTWAWRAGRVELLRRRADRVASLFQFETNWLSRRGIAADYVGHPLVHLQAALPPPPKPAILLCPGSRTHEIAAILPRQLAAAGLLKRSWPKLRVGVLAAPGKEKQLESYLRHHEMTVSVARIEEGWTLAWCAAGTVSLELALAEIPWVLTHRVSPLSYRLVRGRLTTPFLGMPNILLGREASPELIQDDFSPTSLAAISDELLVNPRRLKQIRVEWRKLREILGKMPKMQVDALAWEMLITERKTTR